MYLRDAVPLGFNVCIIRGAPAMSFHTWRWRELERMIC